MSAWVSGPVLTRFMVISDTHGLDLDTNEHAFRPAAKVDVLLHCGDLTQVGGQSEFRKAIRMLSSIDAELKLVIAGNHDLELDPQFDPDELEDHRDAVALWTGHEAKQANIVYLEEGTHSFTLSNGSHFTIYASPYQPEFGDWAFMYKHDEDRFNTQRSALSGVTSIAQNPVPQDQDVHIMMTHGPPHGILDTNEDGQHLGCRNLLQAVGRTKPLMHCFGHIHEGYGIDIHHNGDTNTTQDIVESATVTQLNVTDSTRQLSIVPNRDTIMVNAAIQTAPSQWENAPWIVDLPLPLRMSGNWNTE